MTPERLEELRAYAALSTDMEKEMVREIDSLQAGVEALRAAYAYSIRTLRLLEEAADAATVDGLTLAASVFYAIRRRLLCEIDEEPHPGQAMLDQIAAKNALLVKAMAAYAYSIRTLRLLEEAADSTASLSAKPPSEGT